MNCVQSCGQALASLVMAVCCKKHCTQWHTTSYIAPCLGCCHHWPVRPANLVNKSAARPAACMHALPLFVAPARMLLWMALMCLWSCLHMHGPQGGAFNPVRCFCIIHCLCALPVSAAGTRWMWDVLVCGSCYTCSHTVAAQDKHTLRPCYAGSQSWTHTSALATYAGLVR